MRSRRSLRSLASRRSWVSYFLGVALGGAVVACSSSSSPGSDGLGLVQSKLARDTAPVVDPADESELVKDNTTFAFDLYQKVASGDETSNLVYSPYSISIALAMTYAGAGAPTDAEMAGALDFTLPPAKLHPAFDALDLALASRSKAQPASNGTPFQLSVVDSLWGEKTLTFAEPFLDTLAVNYGAGMHVVDFIDAADAARDAINSWVASETQNRISNLLPDGSLGASTRLVLVNAIYFNATWQSEFDANDTTPAPFHLADGSTSTVDMMNQTAGMGFAKGSNYSAVELTYAGAQTSMVFIVPDDGAFAAVEQGLTGDFVGSVFDALAPTTVTLGVPKFTVQGATISLKQELSALGMADAFTAAANFSGITTADQLFIDDVVHQAFVKVDEKGTEAAAATAVIDRDAGAILANQTVVLDHPFFYLIRDIPTNTVLFVGRETNPT